ncbi:MAG: hypothetical protein ND807_17190 [Vicinamibacterales bacterium]|nr:hypothetical protein [Vicinamibacterales bacterium]
MPFLRFTRDKRGYETTSLVHAVRQHGRSRQRILYWFRTPPGVKVGRPALDENAIRWIEEHNRDIEFDWQKILESRPPPAPPPDDGRNRRVRRDARDKSGRGARTARPARPAVTPVREAQPVPAEPEIEPEMEPINVPTTPAMDALEQITHPDAEELPPVSAIPGELVVGREQLTRLRARYAELQARITERGGDAARIEELRGQAESLNPDAWVTEADVRKGMEEFEAKIRDLRAALGLRRRRRSRRGGRRRHRGAAPAGPAGSTAPAGEPSHSGEPSDSDEAGDEGDPGDADE